ncbi:hypothetical protein EHI8A_004070 [Entamoeba histolytica HM-1:IMSS-B]|uniref:Uncharacterized protein n=8 Tax=Entamoeba TaxID=5758 RepID=C4M1B3_ENTH1|nr:hypothetical protein ENU1_213600 [Entamoeba nuttalli P19]XP_656001.1 hypothetical protein EHI_169900 [Entamoeba histolytica HM-1:IMSS]EMD43667.1 Hypothetical protein EHI5A_016880 [Entamoeba histolytica KU27]EMH75525.1 hypothetical protein EHI8A_004070 [Entamoeba histolytica HM-1:IMSS-B]EMS16649.1 hypothetical protein KM1_017280 [Entamoeba histolytica HM-3:IMSS]ENY63502.1 hypothetical protein EHI7A_005810 [Entamoeba histolytica HM-1:IMSS-A]GAT94989.1 hypothetical protein CL6EHI_169900 [Enta|eukprot:XP_008860699.1 hypothetical protein ENU1_213600 [Entamoeba nuttalli P19]
MSKFVILPFLAAVFLIIGAILTIVSLPLPWAMANVKTANVHYSFYLLGWTTDNCKDDNGSRLRYGYGNTFEFKDLKSSGICALVFLIIGLVFSFICALFYLLHAFGPCQKCLKKIKLNVGRRTWILLIFAFISLAINIVGMILWLALFFAHNVSEWLAQSSPNPNYGFYIELASIVVTAVGILIAMFWKHS